MLVIVTAVLALGRPAAGYANAGVQRDHHCCCIDAEHCHCHDHGDRGRHAVQKCGDGETWMSPDLAPAVPSVPNAPAHRVVPQVAPLEMTAVAPPSRMIEVEVPPF